MNSKVDFLIVGGGVAGANCAKTLRQRNGLDSIMIACAESYLPYNRPPLSKGLLLGYETIENINVYSNEFYKANNIDVRLNTRIASVDGLTNLAVDTRNNKFEFGKLLVATGCSLRKLPIPGSDLKNIFYLRTLDDAQAIIKTMKNAKSAVIIGGGFIGMELVSAFVQNGLRTTMLVRENKLFNKLNSNELSQFFLDYYKKNGVEIIFNDVADRIEGKDKAERVITRNGPVIACDIVSIGIGVSPDVDFLKESGVKLENGVVVDEYLKSLERPDIFVAGDVANFYDPVFRKHRRIEHWDNAIKQGKLAAKNMLGHMQPFNMVPYFFSDLFDISWEFIGDNSDFDETIMRGSFKDKSAILFYLKENKLKAAFLLMQTPRERTQIEQWIINHTDMAPLKQKLSSTEIRLNRAA